MRNCGRESALGPVAALPPGSAAAMHHRGRQALHHIGGEARAGQDQRLGAAAGRLRTTSFMKRPVPCSMPLALMMSGRRVRDGRRDGRSATSRSAWAGNRQNERVSAAQGRRRSGAAARPDSATSWPARARHMRQRRAPGAGPEQCRCGSCLGPELARAIDGRLRLVERPAGAGGNAEIIGEAQRQPLGPGPGDHRGIVGAELRRRHDEVEAVARPRPARTPP